ncbi:hypothetical protein BOTBODRAFT_99602 [Botryobasidium botryosum FD-172 SS1]|uniref:C2H2-type domain-containing protein n=1 Tax=Botryobasidium botryosum (strain FD-172 SS1) TaxID=930990 RepID=A0A067NBX9_BOTB1|nr:hypothetical protein BOTBODRAFT_99602 [Botryobasidium botryosum FD-172 SS1]
MGLSPAQGQGLPHPLSARYTLTTIAPPTAGAAAPYLQIPTGSPQPQQPGQAQSQHTPQPGSPSQSQSQSPSDTNPSSPFRLPPILQVEKQHVTTTATQAASASRRRNDALFKCPVPGCGSTFTRRFNLRGHLRSHTEERPFVCEWPGCGKGFARQHDCKRHQALHSSKSGQHTCEGCSKTFSRMDALNRHLRSEGGSGCRQRSQPGESSRGAASSSASGSGSASSVAGPSMSSAGQAMPVPPPVAGTRRHRKDDPEDGDERRPAPSNR